MWRMILLVLLFIPGCASVENSLVYHPWVGPTPYEKPPAPFEDVHLPLADGTKVHARWAPHPEAKGAILFCHGNGGNVESWGASARELFQKTGHSVLIFDYPGYGLSEGKVSETGCYAAAEAAYAWLIREKRVPAEQVLLYGESLGGAVAVDLATKQPHRALVLVRTFTSVPEVADDQLPILPCSSMMNNRFDSLQKIGQCPRPIFLAHAEKDRMIQMRHARRLMDACSGQVEFCLMRNMGHNDPLPDEFFVALHRFLEKT